MTPHRPADFLTLREFASRPECPYSLRHLRRLATESGKRRTGKTPFMFRGGAWHVSPRLFEMQLFQDRRNRAYSRMAA